MNFDEILWRIRNEPEWVILIGLLLVILIGGGSYYFYQRSVSYENLQQNFARSLTRYNVAERTGNYRAAAQGLRQFVNQYPDAQQIDVALFFLGKSYLKIGQPTNAIKQFRRIVNQHSDSLFYDAAQLHIGYAQFRRGELELALRQFRKVSDRKDSGHLWQEAVWQEAVTHKAGGDTAAALTALKSLTDQAGNEDSFWVDNARRMKSSLEK